MLFVNHKCEPSITRSPAELQAQFGAVRHKIADHFKVPAVPDQRTPSNDCDLHFVCFPRASVSAFGSNGYAADAAGEPFSRMLRWPYPTRYLASRRPQVLAFRPRQ